MAGATVCRGRISHVLGWRTARDLAVRVRSVPVAKSDSLVPLLSAGHDLGGLRNVFSLRYACITLDCRGDRAWIHCDADLGQAAAGQGQLTKSGPPSPRPLQRHPACKPASDGSFPRSELLADHEQQP